MRISDWSSDVCSSDLPACARTSHLLLSFETTSGGSSWLIPHLAALHPAAISRPWNSPSAGHCTATSISTSWRTKSSDISPSMKATTALCQHTRSEEHTSELQSLMRISYAVFCLKKKQRTKIQT